MILKEVPDEDVEAIVRDMIKNDRLLCSLGRAEKIINIAKQRIRRKKMNFDEWFKKKYPGIELYPWQETAIRDCLFAAYPDRQTPSGKSFCLKVLSEFMCEHGTNYEL